MASRTVFIFRGNKFLKEDYEFTWFGGMSNEQRQRCVASLHNSFKDHNQGKRILEISSISEEPLGAALSAMNLTNVDGRIVETMYQGSKVFEFGGPYRDMYHGNGFNAKKDTRLKTSGSLKYFNLDGLLIDKEPKGLFYNWIWCNALHQQFDRFTALLDYDAFTDIFFNKGVSCQAEAAAMYVALVKTGWVEEAMQSIEHFSKLIYGTTDIYINE